MEEELCGRDPNKPREPIDYVPGEVETRSGIVVIPADDVRARTIGFTCKEEIGIGFFNPKGLTKLRLGEKP